MIPTEPQPGEENTQQAAEKDIEAVVAVVEPAAGGYVCCGDDGCGGDDEEVGWRGGGLVSELNEVWFRGGFVVVGGAWVLCVKGEWGFDGSVVAVVVAVVC